MPDPLEPGRPLAELLDRWRLEDRLIALAPVDEGSPSHIGAESLEITGIHDDSRAVEGGGLFVAIRGLRVDGHDYVRDAIERGAVAVAVEEPFRELGVPQVVVRQGSAALASAAAWWHGDPSRELLTVGVTGTNGKTTTSFLARTVLEAGGIRTGLVGTIGIGIGSELRRNEEPNTTPGALALQRLLREMVDAGQRAVVIETSSHGLAADRVGSIDYDAAIFTNLSHEHLDFHGTFEAYRDAKVSLFQRLRPEGTGERRGQRPGERQRERPGEPPAKRSGIAIVNIDDGHGPMFADAARATGARVITYGTSEVADLRIARIDGDAARTSFDLQRGSGVTKRVHIPIAGRYNAHNVAAAFALAVGWELDPEAVIAGLEAFAGVPGRMEVLARGQPFGVVIDFAHTPKSIDAVAGELEALVAPNGGAVISVFGSSGERDVAKRPLMGEAAARHSRVVIVTEDDSRGEDPASIFEQIAAGAEKAGKRRDDDLLVIPDRREAIGEAFGRAGPGDVVLLAGKGHETWNMGPNGPEPWSDREAAEGLLREQVP
jgi:UDP-N-acetylmuramoyl-L-alanyl-D-glutamate--2,6-diaminopimelate ligase